MDEELETDPDNLSLRQACLIELWVNVEREARIKVVTPGLSKHYIPVAVWLSVKFEILAGWRVDLRPNAWPDLVREIRVRPARGDEWEEPLTIWRTRNPGEDDQFNVYTVDTNAGIIEFLAKAISREVVDVIQRAIPDE